MFHYIGRGEPDSKDTLLITAPSPPSKVNVLLSLPNLQTWFFSKDRRQFIQNI